MERTWAGLFAGGSVLLVLGAVTNTPELVILGVLAVAVCLHARIATRGQIPLTVERELLPETVVVGEPASLVVSVHNPSARSVGTTIVRQGVGEGMREHSVPHLGPGASDRIALPLDTGRRGVFPLGSIELQRSDPLRIAGSNRRDDRELSLVVHPRVHQLAPIRAVSRKDVEGDGSDRHAEGSESFHALREYHSGDDHRLIHWKTSARSGELVVKQFVDLWKPSVLVVFDDHVAHHPGGLFEEAVEVAASIADCSTRHRHVVELLVGSGRRATARTAADQRVVLDLLAAVRPVDGADLRELAGLAARHGSDRALVLVTGDPPPDQLRSFIAATGSFQRRIVIRLRGDRSAPPTVEMSPRGDEAITAGGVDAVVAGWARLMS